MADRDYGAEAQAAAEKRLEELDEALEAETMGVDPMAWPEDMAGPYCGCETCVIREILHVAWPIIRQAEGT